MPKKRLTDKQKEMLELLPDGLPPMSNATELVLANIILWYGTDYGCEHDYIFRTNEDMAQDTGVSKQTVITSVRNLEQLGLIERNRGQRGQASEYYLSDEIKQKINLTSTEKKSMPKEMVVERNTSTSQINETMGQITKGQMTELIGQITDAVCERMSEIITLKFNELHDALINSATQGKKAYLTTESETEVDIEILNNIRQDIERKPERTSTSDDNAYVTKVFNWLDDELDYLFKVKDINAYNGMTNKIAKYVDDIDKSKFSEKQWECVLKKLDRWGGIVKAKEKYFNRQRNNKSDSDKADISKGESTVDECDTISVNPIDSLLDDVTQQGRFFSEEVVAEWVAKEVKKYTSYESWEKRTKDKLNRRFGEDWLVGNGAYAYPLFLDAQKYAQKYYQESHETVQQVDDDELAPWEVPFEQKW